MQAVKQPEAVMIAARDHRNHQSFPIVNYQEDHLK